MKLMACKDGVCSPVDAPEKEELVAVSEQGMFGDLGIQNGTPVVVEE